MYKYCCRLNTGCVYSCGWIIRFCFSLMSFSFSLSFSTKCTSAILVLLKYSHKQLQDAGCISFTHVQQYPVLLCCYFPELKYFWIAKVSVVGQSAWKLHAKHYTRTVRSMGLGLRGGGVRAGQLAPPPCAHVCYFPECRSFFYRLVLSEFSEKDSGETPMVYYRPTYVYNCINSRSWDKTLWMYFSVESTS